MGEMFGCGQEIPPWVDQSKWWRDESGGGAAHQEHTQWRGSRRPIPLAGDHTPCGSPRRGDLLMICDRPIAAAKKERRIRTRGDEDASARGETNQQGKQPMHMRNNEYARDVAMPAGGDV